MGATFSSPLSLPSLPQDVQTSVDQYATLFTGARTNIGSISSASSIESRQQNYKTLVENFYDLATDFYEYGWGQVKIGNKYNVQHGLADFCKSHQGDFQTLSDQWGEESFDAAFAVEATCHSPDKTKCFSEVLKILKPGGLFANYEWIVTDKYSPSNPTHTRIKEGIEDDMVGEGNDAPVCLCTGAGADSAKGDVEDQFDFECDGD
eukprot:evm.model.NODE_1688_length_16549_cov_34.402924.2